MAGKRKAESKRPTPKTIVSFVATDDLMSRVEKYRETLEVEASLSAVCRRLIDRGLAIVEKEASHA